MSIMPRHTRISLEILNNEWLTSLHHQTSETFAYLQSDYLSYLKAVTDAGADNQSFLTLVQQVHRAPIGGGDGLHGSLDDDLQQLILIKDGVDIPAYLKKRVQLAQPSLDFFKKLCVLKSYGRLVGKSGQ
jgi:hypothetical protein